jgi:hypothetical protein
VSAFWAHFHLPTAGKNRAFRYSENAKSVFIPLQSLARRKRVRACLDKTAYAVLILRGPHFMTLDLASRRIILDR